MLMPKKNRLAILSYLFKEGVVVTPKDTKLANHPQIPVPQLHVIKLMQSLLSKNLVKEKFNWQYLYYVLTDEGIEYLRNYLHISEDTVPATLKKPSKPQPPSTLSRQYGDEGGRGRGRGRGGRGGYRSERGGFSKDGSAPSNFNPEFEGGDRGRGGYRGRGGSEGGERGRSSYRGRGGAATATATE